VRPRLTIAFTALIVLFVAARACFGPEERIAFLLYDDAYYYLGVAHHLAAGDGSTFDGLHRTNGYHPLWCWMLVPVVSALRDPGAAVRGAGVIWFALAAAVPFAAWWALRRRLGDEIAAAAGAIFTLQPWIALALARPNGLETPMYALAILVVLGIADRVAGNAEAPSTGRSLGLGALIGAAVLTRLDAGALAVAVALSLLSGGRRWGVRIALARLAAVVAAATIVAGPSLAWNLARFDSPLPISGRVIALEAEREREAVGGALSPLHLLRRTTYAVADIPASLVRRAALGLPGESFVASAPRGIGLAATALVVLAAIAAWWKRCRREGVPGDPVVVLALFALLHYAAYAVWLWTPGEDVYRAYYFVPELLAISVLAAWWLGRVRWQLTAVVVMLLGIHLVVETERYLKLLDAQPGRVADRFVYGWIRANLPGDAVLGARDAGKLAWFSGRTVVGLDGLNNDATFFDVLREGREGAYVCDSAIDFVLIDRPYLADYAAQLRRTATCGFRDVDPTSKYWAVLEVVR